jgi:transcriptional regulator GlxA family with amidase domain
MLHLIRSRLGMAVALDVASVFIYDQARAATDAQPLVSLGRLDGFDPRLAQAIRLMEGHVDQPLTIAAIARRVAVTSRTLEGIFRKSLNESPGAYYLRLRLHAARRLVLDTSIAMADVAERCGFSSSAAFSRAFARTFGTPPSAMRRGGNEGGSVSRSNHL